MHWSEVNTNMKNCPIQAQTNVNGCIHVLRRQKCNLIKSESRFKLIIFDVDYFARTKSDRQYFELKANRRKLGRILYVHLHTVDVLENEWRECFDMDEKLSQLEILKEQNCLFSTVHSAQKHENKSIMRFNATFFCTHFVSYMASAFFSPFGCNKLIWCWRWKERNPNEAQIYTPCIADNFVNVPAWSHCGVACYFPLVQFNSLFPYLKKSILNIRNG